MIFPDYKNSIVNLVSSIGNHYGVRKRYSMLKNLNLNKKVVLIIIDGLGYNFVKNYPGGCFLRTKIDRKLTSVFPSTTAAAITSYNTGVSTGEHGITGWFVYQKELGTITVPLRYTSRSIHGSFEYMDLDQFYYNNSLFGKKDVKTGLVLPSHIIDEPYTLNFNEKSVNYPYTTIDGFFMQMKKAIKESKNKFIYSYLPLFDSYCHKVGVNSEEVYELFEYIDYKFMKLFETKFKNVSFLISSDHGMVDTEKKKVIFMNKHPKLKDMLVLPLTGEPRAAYCFVRLNRERDFVKYVKTHLGHAVNLVKSSKLIDMKVFGLYQTHKELRNRIGDYVMLMKDNYTIYDPLLNEKQGFMVGNHGGISEDEMYVPLIHVK